MFGSTAGLLAFVDGFGPNQQNSYSAAAGVEGVSPTRTGVAGASLNMPGVLTQPARIFTGACAATRSSGMAASAMTRKMISRKTRTKLLLRMIATAARYCGLSGAARGE